MRKEEPSSEEEAPEDPGKDVTSEVDVLTKEAKRRIEPRVRREDPTEKLALDALSPW